MGLTLAAEPVRKPAKIGRPTRFTLQVAEAICWRMASGELLKDIASDPDMPPSATIYRWTEEKPAFREMFARARILQAHWFADHAVAEGLAAAPETAQAQRVKFDAARWFAGKLEPRVYGEKTLHVGGDGEGPIMHKMSLDWSALDAEELLQFRALLEKATIRRGTATIEGEAEDGEE